MVEQRAALGRRQSAGRVVLHRHRLRRGVAAPAPPHREHREQHQHRHQQQRVREQESQHARRDRRRPHRALVPAHHDRHAFLECQRPAQLERDLIAFDPDVRVLRARSVGAGEHVGPDAGGAGGQPHAGGGVLDRHLPLVAGDVPVQLVVGVEEPHGVRHPVADHHVARGVHGAGHPDLERAVMARAAALDLERRALAVGDRRRLQVQMEREPLRRAVLDRDVADDAVPGAREPEPDLLPDLGHAGGLHGDVGVEPLDRDLARPRRSGERRGDGQRNRGDRHDRRRRRGLGDRGDLDALGAHARVEKLTLGDCRSAVSSTSKKVRGPMPNMPAIKFEGNCTTCVFRSRTTAL